MGSELIASIRNIQDAIINENKSSITITRTTKVKNTNGGLTSSSATLTPAIDVRLFNQADEEISRTESGFYDRRALKMLAKHNADIKAKTELNEDVFTLNSKNYQIISVLDTTIGGSIVFRIANIQEL